MRKKTILVFATQFMETGGIESHLIEFCNQLSNENISIDLLILNSKMNTKQRSVFNNNCRHLFINSHNTPFRKLFWLFQIAIKLLLKKYNVLYTNGQGETIQWVSRLFKHDKWVHHHHTSGDIVDQKSWGKNYIKTLRSANSVIACSLTNAKNITTLLGRHIESIPCFSRRLSRVNIEGKNLDKIHLGFYGRLIKEKGIEILCRLSNEPEFTNIQIHIWGSSDTYSSSFFSRYNNIDYHGVFNSIEELNYIVSSLDGFLLLSNHSEGLPVSLLEIMSIGLPWLATNKGGIPDIVSDHKSSRVISSNSTYLEYKEHVLHFANDIREKKCNTNNLIETYNLKFDSPVIKHQWLEIFNITL